MNVSITNLPVSQLPYKQWSAEQRAEIEADKRAREEAEIIRKYNEIMGNRNKKERKIL